MWYIYTGKVAAVIMFLLILISPFYTKTRVLIFETFNKEKGLNSLWFHIYEAIYNKTINDKYEAIKAMISYLVIMFFAIIISMFTVVLYPIILIPLLVFLFIKKKYITEESSEKFLDNINQDKN